MPRRGFRAVKRGAKSEVASSASLRTRWLSRNMRAVPCDRPGLVQVTDTCWFNAALNGLLLGEWSRGLMLRALHGMSAAERAHLEAVIDRGVVACPAAPTRAHVLAHAAASLLRGRPPSAIPAASGRYQYDGEAPFANRSMNLMLSVYRTDPALLNRVMNHHGMVVDTDTRLPEALLHAIFKPRDIAVITTPLRGGAVPAPPTIRASAKMVVLKKPLETTVIPLSGPGPEVPLTLARGLFRLDHAYLAMYTVSGTLDVRGHAVAAFRCRDTEYIFDSAAQRPIKCTWSTGDLSDLRTLYLGKELYRGRRVTHVAFVYVCYVNSHHASVRTAARAR